MSTFRVNVFTWNMQKCPCFPNGEDVEDKTFFWAPKNADRQLRNKLITQYCGTSHFSFITEASKGLRDAVNTSVNSINNVPTYNRTHWNINTTGSQKDVSPCQSVLCSIAPLQSKSNGITIISGRKDASRCPAEAVVSYNNRKGLLVSLHATSGNSGSHNTTSIVVEAKKRMTSLQCDFLIVGGDFNSYHNSDGYFMPTSPTNQGSSIGGNGIDGFYVAVKENCGLTIQSTQCQTLVECDNTKYKLDLASQVYCNAGFKQLFVQEDGRSIKRLRRSKATYDRWLRLSDHVPVIGHIIFNDSDDVHDVNMIVDDDDVNPLKRPRPID